MDKLGVLKQVFGHTSFRPGQEELVDALLSGRDALGVMPTGAGKSICYQVPALLLPGTTLVISPLISLMKDQVAALTENGVAAAFINSSLSLSQIRAVYGKAAEGGYRILYVAPERLGAADFKQLLMAMQIPLVAVDEAHCVSQWGQDFRPNYLKIAETVAGLPHRPAVGAFTATATAQVKDDIVRLLELLDPLLVTTGFDRPNLYFDVARPANKREYLGRYLLRRRDKSGIVYCATRKTVESVCADLLHRGVAATRYHAGLTDDERRQNQEDFVYDRAQVMVATNAFGMGIDKSNVGFVLHYNMPKNMESYYQEAGRAGRDGEPADCTLLFSQGDVQTAKFLIQNSEENGELSAEEQQAVRGRDLERLRRMTEYCKTSRCLRACILGYFGEKADGACGNCGNCNGRFTQEDITTDAQKILSGVARVEKKYRNALGVSLIVRMLHGSREQRVLQLGLNELPTYGVMRGEDPHRIRAAVDYLIGEGFLALTQGEYPVVRLTKEAAAVLFHGERVCMPVRETPGRTGKTPGDRGAARAPSDLTPADEELLSALKSVRTKLAQAERVPAYLVFSNATLSDMAARKPQTPDELLQVSGVGEIKAKRYGGQFLQAIRSYMQTAEPAD